MGFLVMSEWMWDRTKIINHHSLGVAWVDWVGEAIWQMETSDAKEGQVDVVEVLEGVSLK